MTKLEKDLVLEMKQQNLQPETINGIMWRLKTPKKQQEFLDYLMTTREKLVPLNKAILKSIEIKNKKD